MTKFEKYFDNILKEKYCFFEHNKKIFVVPNKFKNDSIFDSLQICADYKILKTPYNHWKDILYVLDDNKERISLLKNEFINYYQKKKISSFDKKEFLEDLYNYIETDDMISTIEKCSFEKIEDKIKIASDMFFYPKILEDLKPIALEYSTNMEDFYNFYFQRKKGLMKKNVDIIFRFLKKEFEDNIEKINPILKNHPALNALFNEDMYIEGFEEKNFDFQFEIDIALIHKYFPKLKISTLEFYIKNFTEEYIKIIDYNMKNYNENNGKNKILFVLNDKNNNQLFQWKQYKKILFHFLKDAYLNEDKYYNSIEGLIRKNIAIFINKNLLNETLDEKQPKNTQKLKV